MPHGDRSPCLEEVFAKVQVTLQKQEYDNAIQIFLNELPALDIPSQGIDAAESQRRLNILLDLFELINSATAEFKPDELIASFEFEINVLRAILPDFFSDARTRPQCKRFFLSMKVPVENIKRLPGPLHKYSILERLAAFLCSAYLNYSNLSLLQEAKDLWSYLLEQYLGFFSAPDDLEKELSYCILLYNTCLNFNEASIGYQSALKRRYSLYNYNILKEDIINERMPYLVAVFEKIKTIAKNENREKSAKYVLAQVLDAVKNLVFTPDAKQANAISRYYFYLSKQSHHDPQEKNYYAFLGERFSFVKKARSDFKRCFHLAAICLYLNDFHMAMRNYFLCLKGMPEVEYRNSVVKEIKKFLPDYLRHVLSVEDKQIIDRLEETVDQLLELEATKSCFELILISLIFKLKRALGFYNGLEENECQWIVDEVQLVKFINIVGNYFDALKSKVSPADMSARADDDAMVEFTMSFINTLLAKDWFVATVQGMDASGLLINQLANLNNLLSACIVNAPAPIHYHNKLMG